MIKLNTTDLIGKKFGKLIVIRFDHIEHKRDKNGKNRDKGFWLCKCDGTDVPFPGGKTCPCT